MSTLWYNYYLVEVATKGGGGGQKLQKSGYVVCAWPQIKSCHVSKAGIKLVAFQSHYVCSKYILKEY